MTERLDAQQVALSGRLAEAAEAVGAPLSSGTVERLIRYLNLLCHWNRKINLVGTLPAEEIVTRHIVDSLTPLALQLPVGQWADAGSGAGFPGLVLKIARPEIAMTLIESSRKKAAFLHSVVGHLQLSGVSVCCDRLEQCQAPRSGFDLIVSRAVAPATVIASGVRLMHPNGRFIFFQSQQGAVTLEHQSFPGAAWEKTYSTPGVNGGPSRALVVMKRTSSRPGGVDDPNASAFPIGRPMLYSTPYPTVGDLLS